MIQNEKLYGKIPYVNKKVSRIFFGTAFPPIITGGDGTELFEAALRNLFKIQSQILFDLLWLRQLLRYQPADFEPETV